MTKYQIPFKKIVWGTIQIEADSKEEALKKYYENDYDELDNDCEYYAATDKREEFKDLEPEKEIEVN